MQFAGVERDIVIVAAAVEAQHGAQRHYPGHH
jgi:hypothetical protein